MALLQYTSDFSTRCILSEIPRRRREVQDQNLKNFPPKTNNCLNLQSLDVLNLVLHEVVEM
jgi:hypothetical protein